jgi:hypothetical protein
MLRDEARRRELIDEGTIHFLIEVKSKVSRDRDEAAADDEAHELAAPRT